MAKKLATVHDVFSIEGRGLFAVLEDGWAIPDDEKIQKNESVRIRRSEGQEIKTYIKSFESMRRVDDGPTFCISFPKDIGMDDIAKGDEIFLERDGAESVLWDEKSPSKRSSVRRR